MAKVIYANAEKNNPQIADMKIGIKPKGHTHQEKFGGGIPLYMIEQKIS
ncbi:MAG: hypothetical protein NC123_05675 [Butyrivibrio sp.]|nr:hypothetical protein [Acetatifactor muris]MCM1559017.1 hypothetical protein [Butyrivibrio sp.]